MTCSKPCATQSLATVDIVGTIVTLQAFGKVVGQIAEEDFPSEEGLLTAPAFALKYNERNVIVQASRY